eukprot:TRINITY_DN57327_c0_g1_i1.p1 TRINITY_DN57327_c0_g1~~TRINITY_DN57327_c0_g1_i1.p1  ORF type:complete len:272 (-),score=41.20 TRINITY_DN57327_c0_g1_i1:63-800(-)
MASLKPPEGTAHELNAESPRPLRLLCLHGHGGYAARTCGKLADMFKSVQSNVECQCIEAPFAEPSRRKEGRQWWRYNDGGEGDLPEDWAEMEVATTRVAEALQAEAPFDGVLGFSQGAEMVHTLALLAHRSDPRIHGKHAPRFLVSLSGAVNPDHFEVPGGGGPPPGIPGPRTEPRDGELRTPCLFLADFKSDNWYPRKRFDDTLRLYRDATVVSHSSGHSIPSSVEPEAASSIRSFLARFMRHS